MTKVAVCMATYNGGEYLKEMLDSLSNQTFQDFTVYIFDDGSTDNTKEVIESFKDKLAMVVEHNKGIHNIGIVKGRAIQMALRGQHKYIQILDHDDLLEPSFLEEMVKRLEGGCDFVVCNGYTFGEVFGSIANTIPDMNTLLETNTLTSWVMAKSKVWRKHNFPPLAHLEDWGLFINWIEAGYKGGVVEKPLYGYRMHSEQFHKITNREWGRHRENMLLYLEVRT